MRKHTPNGRLTLKRETVKIMKLSSDDLRDVKGGDCTKPSSSSEVDAQANLLIAK